MSLEQRIRLRTEMPDFPEGTVWVNESAPKDQLAGKAVLIHFWALTCPLCKKSMPLINKWREAYAQGQHLQVIGVHTPRSEAEADPEAVRAAIKEYGLEHPVIMDHDRIVAGAFRNACVPAYYLYDRNSLLRHYQVGESGLQILTQRLQKMMSKND